MAPLGDISAERLGGLLRTSFIGRAILAQELLESTNLTAAALAPTSEEGLLVVADQQSGGRGRNGRKWASPPGRNLYFSLVLKPGCHPSAVPQLAIVAALSMARALGRLGVRGIGVKWPNDMHCCGRKLCGILCSMSSLGDRAEYAIAGIGLNVNMEEQDFPEDLRGAATSLLMETGRRMDRAQVLAEALNTIEEDYSLWKKHSSLGPFMERWAGLDVLRGKTVTAEYGGGLISGKAEGIESSGLLKLETADGLKLVSAGDTHIVNQGQA